MARPLRIEFDGAVYHITSRGNEQKPIFGDDEDRITFLDTVKEVNSRFNWLCHAYCLMDSHYHLVIETPDANLSKGMRQLNSVYTQKFNRRLQRTGHVFQGRYKAILVERESHLLEVCRYVVLNPVRAGVVERAGEWKWSSYNGTAKKGERHACLTTEWVLSQFARRQDKARASYRRFVEEGVGTDTIWEDVRGQCILGQDGFIDTLKEHIDGQRTIEEIPRGQRFVDRQSLQDIFAEGLAQDRNSRDEMVRAAVEEYGYSQKQVADHLGMHYSTISRLMNRHNKMSRFKT